MLRDGEIKLAMEGAEIPLPAGGDAEISAEDAALCENTAGQGR
jgi:hypothetical protein